ncbi:TorD/DmsD family molecular chaperone [Gordonibacter sp.]|uniref:TorD/DmsD family molecular chaperone n=1 Tax=Gordonibacter sp. TaxID=1968902 RepID=UPI002FC5DD51
MDHDRCEARLRKAIGCADMCELLSAAFSFPDEPLAAALADGSFTSDVTLCMEDIGADPLAASAASEALASLVGCEPAELLTVLRKAYSQLYLAPGVDVPVFPYESAFRFVAEDRAGAPVLFRSPVTLDVEACFDRAGVAAANARKEPCDSVFSEFAFLSYLYACLAEAIRVGDGQLEEQWSSQLDAFVDQHVAQWLPAFMEQTIEAAGAVAGGEAYAALARFGSQALGAMACELPSAGR